MGDNSVYQFCGSEFWNSNLTWYTDTPRLTTCFEETVLAWLPCAFLVVFLPFDVYSSMHSKAKNIPWNWRSYSKVCLCGLNILASAIDFVSSMKDSIEGNLVYPVGFFTPVVRALSVACCIALITFHRVKGVRSSGVLFLFWFIVVISGLPQVSSVFRQSDGGLNLHDVTFLAYYLASVIIFAVHFVADAAPLETYYPKTENPCPEVGASFASKLTFSWFDSLTYLGYKKPLVVNDLWSLRFENTAAELFPAFDKNWKATVEKNVGKNRPVPTSTSYQKENGVKLSQPKSSKPSSILPALFKTFGPSFSVGCGLKFCQDLLGFVSPQVLKLLISFIEGDEPIWKGYLYAALMLTTATMQTLFLSHYFFTMNQIGLRIRTALTSMIYRKALRLSNSSRKESTVGEIVNLMAVDAQRFFEVVTHLCLLWSAPLQISLALYFLWQFLGPSVLAGFCVMIIMIPINGVISNKMKLLQVKQMKNKDERVKMMNEILSGIKVLKLYAWEPSFEQRILKIRNKEVKVLRESAYFGAATSFLWTCTPFLVSLITFAVYVLSDDSHVLDATTAFVSLSLFNILRFPLSMLPMMISSVIQTKVSVDRINKFMNAEELDPEAVTHDEKEDDPIIVENGSFKWETEGELILKNINLRVKPQSLVAVVGVVGAGKTSLLSALLGEMDKISGRVNVKGKVAYVSQTAWIQNNTLQENILFGKSFSSKNYHRVIDACALKSDFDMLPGGDQTEIGEKGINLSGGQKQRVNLARAVYCDADVYYLDDPLSAVDSHVGKHIFENVVGPQGLLRHKTRILVTHGITHLHEADLVVVIKDGAISEIGTFKELVNSKGAFSEFLSVHLQEVDKEELDELDEEVKQQILGGSHGQLLRQMSTISGSSTSLARKQSTTSQKSLTEFNNKKAKQKDKLIEEEKAETGGVKLSVYKHYLSAVGPVLVCVTVLLNIVYQGFTIGSNAWLSVWSSDPTIYVNGTQDTSKRDMYLGIYGLLGLAQVSGQVVSNLSMAMGGIKAAVSIHVILLARIFHAPMSFFDVTPGGRILSRCAKDTDIVDSRIANTLHMTLGRFTAVLSTLVVITYSTPAFLFVIIPLGFVYFFIQRFYVATSRQLKRLESVTRSPIYTHFSETIQGTPVLRAYSMQERFIKESDDKLDFNQVFSFPGMISNRWLAVRLEMMGNLIIFFAAIFAVVGRETLTAGLVGLSVSYALQVTQALNWMVRMTAEVETNIVAVERIKEYGEAPQEAQWEVTPSVVKNDWPAVGSVEFKDYEVRYRDGLELVLRGITFSIKGGEKVGIVGRTGAGKSSMTLSLFRIIEAAGGCIQIDGVNISKLGLHSLRSRLTIIPQDPVLFSGTLRMNLDPFEKYTDEQTWKALELAHLKNFVSTLPARLQHQVTEGGENLSLGQRQLICLARALLRKTKILVLDEATAAIDLETDNLIQNTIRTEFKSCTVLTIAHRINTIMDSDRVLVLDKGGVVEFEPPNVLLSKKNSVFYGLAKDAGLVS